MVLTPHGGGYQSVTGLRSLLLELMRRQSALKTRHHYTTPKYTSAILAALASKRQYVDTSAMLERANRPIRIVTVTTMTIQELEVSELTNR